jgi:hypothetical protein
LTAKEKEARMNLLDSLLGGATAAMGGDAAAAVLAARVEAENNYLRNGREVTKKEIEAHIGSIPETWKKTPYAKDSLAKYAGPAATKGVAGDCTGITYKIYKEAELAFVYQNSEDFPAAAAVEGFPFIQVHDDMQVNDVLLFSGHVALYAGKDESGMDTMWTTTSNGFKLQYTNMYGDKKIKAVYRYQVPNESK